MAAFLDILGSLLIRGGIILILLRLTLSMQEVLYERTEKAALERNLAAVSAVVWKTLKTSCSCRGSSTMSLLAQ